MDESVMVEIRNALKFLVRQTLMGGVPADISPKGFADYLSGVEARVDRFMKTGDRY